MNNRLNVTEAERLCYSCRKLQAISALRNAGINPTVFGLHKDYHVPVLYGKVYLVQHPTGAVYHFASLAEIHRYAAEYQAWKAQRPVTWQEWRRVLPKPKARQKPCVWPDCSSGAAGIIDKQALCQAHALIYGQISLTSGRWAS